MMETCGVNGDSKRSCRWGLVLGEDKGVSAEGFGVGIGWLMGHPSPTTRGLRSGVVIALMT